MRRPTRLDSARPWLESGADMTVRTYARRYGVDRYTAYAELHMLGARLSAKDERWSVLPPPVPKRARREDSEPKRVEEGLPDSWLEWGGELVFVAGFTSGGAPYGVQVQDFPAEALPRRAPGGHRGAPRKREQAVPARRGSASAPAGAPARAV